MRFGVERRLTLSETEHDTHADSSHDAVSEEETERSSVSQSATSSEEKTGTDNTLIRVEVRQVSASLVT